MFPQRWNERGILFPRPYVCTSIIGSVAIPGSVVLVAVQCMYCIAYGWSSTGGLSFVQPTWREPHGGAFTQHRPMHLHITAQIHVNLTYYWGRMTNVRTTHHRPRPSLYGPQTVVPPAAGWLVSWVSTYKRMYSVNSCLSSPSYKLIMRRRCAIT